MFHIAVPDLAGLLIVYLVRTVLAVAFFRETALKLRDIRKFAKNDSVPLPVAWFIVTAECAAAVSFTTGFLTQLAAAGVMLLMLSTISLHLFKWHSPYPAGRGGWEYDLLLFTLAAVLFVSL